VEAATTRIEREAVAMIERIDTAGGTLAAIEQGLIQREIQESAYRAQQAIDTREAVVVGVNQYRAANEDGIDVLRIDPELERQQAGRVAAIRARRDDSAWRASIDDIVAAARSETNLVPPIVRAVEGYATLGEISDALRGVFGEHKEIDA